MKHPNHELARKLILCAIERAKDAAAYGHDMADSCELAARDAADLLQDALNLLDPTLGRIAQ